MDLSELLATAAQESEAAIEKTTGTNYYSADEAMKATFSGDSLAKIQSICLSYERRILGKNNPYFGDAFGKVWERIYNAAHSGSIQLNSTDILKYVWTTARNVVIDAHRRTHNGNRNMSATSSIDKKLGDNGNDFTYMLGGNSNAGYSNLYLEQVKKAVDATLDSDILALLELKAEGYKYEELAETFGLPVGTIKGRLHRARKLLQEKLGSAFKEVNYKPLIVNDDIE